MKPIVVGIDVGGPAKGYHAVALSGSMIAGKLHSRDAGEVARWCSAQSAAVVAVDAPCRWRLPGAPARGAERELAAARISCFSTPTRERAEGHAFYAWMFAGQTLYAALAPDYPVFSGEAHPTRVALETFPQAVACRLAGEAVSAKTKLANRTALLARAGLATTALAQIDDVDAALCALTAWHFVHNTVKAYGDAAGGYIIVPRDPLPAPTGAAAVLWTEIMTRTSRALENTPAFEKNQRVVAPPDCRRTSTAHRAIALKRLPRAARIEPELQPVQKGLED